MITPTQSIGVPLNEITQRKHNLWIGVSFGNKFFTTQNIRLLINLGLKLTKDRLLIWLPGRLQAINYRYLENLNRAKSLKKAFTEEAKQKEKIQRVIQELPNQQQAKIAIANYDDVCTPRFIKQRELLYREFSEEKLFYNKTIDIAREVVKARKRTETKDRLESVALYILQELPLFLDGLQTFNSNRVYTAILYPGMGKLDELVHQIKNSKDYKLLRKDLKLETKSGIVDVSLN